MNQENKGVKSNEVCYLCLHKECVCKEEWVKNEKERASKQMCSKCGGWKAPKNVVTGYAGKFCFCEDTIPQSLEEKKEFMLCRIKQIHDTDCKIKGNNKLGQCTCNPTIERTDYICDQKSHIRIPCERCQLSHSLTGSNEENVLEKVATDWNNQY